MDDRELNVKGWNERVRAGDPWTRPVDDVTLGRARRGEWSVLLTPEKPVPRDWFGELRGALVLCLASGGGQQGPVLAAAGATVTVLDASPAQLAQDRSVAERHGLDLTTVCGFMADLSPFDDETFDLVFHPVSNCFAPEILPVWRECFRVLKPGGTLLSGFMNPVVYVFDSDAEARGELSVRFELPYSATTDLASQELRAWIEQHHTVEFSHTFEAQIGGQLAAGFVLTGFFEDGQRGRLLSRYLPIAFASRAQKPER